MEISILKKFIGDFSSNKVFQPLLHLRFVRGSNGGYKVRRSISSTLCRNRKPDVEWQQRTDIWPADKSEEFQRYPIVTAQQLRGRRDRPRRVKMLMRDFIEGEVTSRL